MYPTDVSSISTHLRSQFLWSLERLTLVSTSIQLWKETRIRKKIVALFVRPLQAVQYQKCCIVILNEVKRKTLLLNIPETLKQKLLDCVVPLGAELLMRLYFHRLSYPSVKFKDMKNCIYSLSWYTSGDLDILGMIRSFLNNNFIDTLDKYTMACNVCLESEISRLWEGLSRYAKRKVIQDKNSSYLTKYWTRKMANSLRHMPTCYLNIISQLSILMSATQTGNLLVFRYFWSRLDQDERNKCIVELANIATLKNADANFVIYLIRQMNESQMQCYLLESAKTLLLQIMKDWRWRHLFLTIEKELHSFLSYEEYCYILCALVDRCRNQEEGSLEFRTILGQLLEQNLPDVMQSVFEETLEKLGTWEVLESLLCIEDITNIKLLLQTVSDEFKSQMIQTESFARTCQILIRKRRWNLLRLLLEGAFKSDKDRENFRNNIIKQIC